MANPAGKLLQGLIIATYFALHKVLLPAIDEINTRLYALLVFCRNLSWDKQGNELNVCTPNSSPFHVSLIQIMLFGRIGSFI